MKIKKGDVYTLKEKGYFIVKERKGDQVLGQEIKNLKEFQKTFSRNSKNEIPIQNLGKFVINLPQLI